MFFIGLELCESSIEEVPNRECSLPLAIKTNELHTGYSACLQLKPFSKLNLLFIMKKWTNMGTKVFRNNRHSILLIGVLLCVFLFCLLLTLKDLLCCAQLSSWPCSTPENAITNGFAVKLIASVLCLLFASMDLQSSVCDTP